MLELCIVGPLEGKISENHLCSKLVHYNSTWGPWKSAWEVQNNFLKPKNIKQFGMRINRYDCTRQEVENIPQLIYQGICPCYFNAMHIVIYGNMCVCVSTYWICIFWVCSWATSVISLLLSPPGPWFKYKSQLFIAAPDPQLIIPLSISLSCNPF